MIGIIIACLDTCHELLTRVSIRFIGSLMPTRLVSSGRRGSLALSSTSCHSNCFNIPKRSFISSAGVDRTPLTCFDRRIPWLMKPPGCFCFLDSFVCLSKLLVLSPHPLGCFFLCFFQAFLPTGRVYDSILCRAFDVQKRGGDRFLYGNCRVKWFQVDESLMRNDEV